MAAIVLTLVLYVLAVCRLTRLVVGDKITEPVRNRILRRFGRDSQLTYPVFCAWCMSMWIAFGTAWAVFLLTDLRWWLYPAVALSASQLTGLLHRAEED